MCCGKWFKTDWHYIVCLQKWLKKNKKYMEMSVFLTLVNSVKYPKTRNKMCDLYVNS